MSRANAQPIPGADAAAAPERRAALADRLHALWWSQERRATLLLLDHAGCIVGVRGAEDVVLGYEAPSLVGRPLADLFTPEDRAQGLDAHEREVAQRWLVTQHSRAQRTRPVTGDARRHHD